MLKFGLPWKTDVVYHDLQWCTNSFREKYKIEQFFRTFYKAVPNFVSECFMKKCLHLGALLSPK